MSLWHCPIHGLYGGDVFCPQCGDNGDYVTLDPAQVGRNAERQDRNELGPQGEHAVGAADAAKHSRRLVMSSNDLVTRLFAALAHGDEDHRAWLKDAIDAFFADKPIPAPRGSGNKEAHITTLEAEIEGLREALTLNRSICRDTVRGWMNRVSDIDAHATEALKKIEANSDRALKGHKHGQE